MPSLHFKTVGPKHRDSQGECLRNHGLGLGQLPPSVPQDCTQSLLSCGEERKEGTALLKMTGRIAIETYFELSLQKEKGASR